MYYCVKSDKLQISMQLCRMFVHNHSGLHMCKLRAYTLFAMLLITKPSIWQFLKDFNFAYPVCKNQYANFDKHFVAIQICSPIIHNHSSFIMCKTVCVYSDSYHKVIHQP